MSISFQTNVASMIAEVNLNNNNKFQTNTITQLTSGYRINSSGDDAAGLAVANGYAASVAELTQGVLNGNQGVNTLQIVDGGLSNISTMLNRMQTLATESATSTFTGNRATLDAEYQTLLGEINREASNVGLSSTNTSNATKLSVFVGGGQNASTGSQVNVDLSNGKVDALALGLSSTNVATSAAPATAFAGANSQGVNALNAVTLQGSALVGGTQTFTVNTASGTTSIAVVNQGTGDTATLQLGRLNNALGALGITASFSTAPSTLGQLVFSSSNAFDISASADAGGSTTVGLATATSVAINSNLNSNLIHNTSAGADTVTIAEGGKTTGAITLLTPTGPHDITNLQNINAALSAAGITDLAAVQGQAGYYSVQGASTFTVTAAGAGNSSATATAAATGGTGGAMNAINQITQAVQALGTVQGVVGAGENDLNYAIGLANSQITNFSATESSIRDADVATQAANLTKAQVLEQASVAAMAQANSAPQAILSLLKA